MTLYVEFRVEETNRYDRRGRKLVKVHEVYNSTDSDVPEDHTFIVPGAACEAFIRARREIVRREMFRHGYSHTNRQELDWATLLGGTKQ